MDSKSFSACKFKCPRPWASLPIPSTILSVPQGVGGPQGARSEAAPGTPCLSTAALGQNLQGWVGEEYPGPLSQSHPEQYSKLGAGGAWAGAGSAPRSRSEGEGALGPTPHPLPGQGRVPGRIPPNGCPACSRPSRCPWSPACVYFTRGHALGQADQEGAGKDGSAGRPPGPWLQTQGEHGAQALPWPGQSPESMSSKPCPSWS